MKPNNPNTLIEQVYRLLRYRAMTPDQIVKHFGGNGSVRTAIQRLHRRRRIRVDAWVRRHRLIAAYRAGKRPDAPMPPPLTNADRCRRAHAKNVVAKRLPRKPPKTRSQVCKDYRMRQKVRVASVFEFRGTLALT